MVSSGLKTSTSSSRNFKVSVFESSQNILKRKNRLRLSRLFAIIICTCPLGDECTFARDGRRTMRSAVMRRYTLECPLDVPFHVAIWIFIQYMVMRFWLTRVYHPNGISIGSAVFAQLTRVPNTQTYRPRRGHL